MIGVYLFLLGLASGLALLTTIGYRHVSPRWLKWLLVASGLFVLTRYVTMALFTSHDAPQRWWGWRHCWLASSVGLTLPSIMAIDQLLRHPAMSPAKLLRTLTPLLVIYAVIILFGRMTPSPDHVAGWFPHLEMGWQWLLSGVQAIVVIGFMGLCVALIRKIPSTPIRRALAGLILAYLYLGLDGVVLAVGRWYFRPFLFSEMFALLAIWYAYDTSTKLQQSP